MATAAAIIQIGDFADRPSAIPSRDGILYLAQDDTPPTVYRCNGTTWDQFVQDGTDGADGSNGTSGTNGSTWYSGSGAPGGGTGINGDFYLRTSNGDVYLKSAGSWGVVLNIVGPTGPGSGDMLAANNLSDLANKATARQNLDVEYGVDVQAYDADLATIAGLTATTDNFLQSKASAWASRTPTQVTADLIAVVGDSGSGGTKGLVPAPGSGDAAAGKFLKADGTWATASGGVASDTHAASSKATPVDADEVPLADSAASFALKKLTWANLKATAKAYFDTLYQVLNSNLTTIAGLTATTDNFMQAKSSAWTSRTPTQVTADLIAVVGDSGSGGTKGLVPAPGSGDAAAGKFLKADGTWVSPVGSAVGVHALMHKNGTDQTGVNNATDTLITFGTVSGRSSGLISSSRFTPGKAGEFLIAGHLIGWRTSGTPASNSYAAVSLFKNGSWVREFRGLFVNVASGPVYIPFSHLAVSDNNTDYFELFYWQGSGGTGTIGGGATGTYATIAEVAATGSLNISGLTTDNSPVLTTDYIPYYDASEGANNKLLLSTIGAMELIGTADPAGSSGTITIPWPTTPGNYAVIIIEAKLRKSTSGAADGILRFNADSGSNYRRNYAVKNNTGTAWSGAGVENSATSILGPYMHGSDATAGLFTYAKWAIPYPGDSDNYKELMVQHWTLEATGGPTAFTELVGAWLNTAAITAAELSLASGNFISGCRVTVYGLRRV